MHLADYLITKCSMFLFEIKQRIPHVFLMLETLLPLPLWNQLLKIMTFFIQNGSNNNCLHRISCISCFFFAQCLLSSQLNMELHRSVVYSLLTLNKLLGSFYKQEKEIDKNTFSQFNSSFSVFLKVMAVTKMFKLLTIPYINSETNPLPPYQCCLQVSETASEFATSFGDAILPVCCRRSLIYFCKVGLFKISINFSQN